jgi:hypothetical protein
MIRQRREKGHHSLRQVGWYSRTKDSGRFEQPLFSRMWLSVCGKLYRSNSPSWQRHGGSHLPWRQLKMMCPFLRTFALESPTMSRK